MKFNKNIAFAILIIIILAFSALIKIVSYKIRPVHADEAVFNFFTKKFLTKTYTYDPEYHGTFNVLLSAASTKIFGNNIVGLRIIFVFFSIASLLLLLLLLKDFSKIQLIALSAMFAFSPILNYYSGYAFFESFFVFFYTLFFISAIKLFYGKTNYFCALALSAAFMLSINEITYVLFFVLVVSFLIAAFLRRNPCRSKSRELKTYLFLFKIKKNKRLIKKAAVSLILFLAIIVIFYSALFTQNFFSNILHSVTYNLNKSHETGQNKPFFYYAKVLMLELPTIAVFLTMLLLFVKKASQKKKAGEKSNETDVPLFLAIYSIMLFIILSAIPYKTPWNTIFLIIPIIFTAAASFKGNIKATAVILAVVSAFLIFNTVRITFYDYDNYKNNSLAYVQSTRELPDAIARINYKLNGTDKKGIVISHEYWPLPWYLKNYSVGYYPKFPDYKIDLAKYDFVITDETSFNQIQNKTANLSKNMNLTHFYIKLRPGVRLYVFFP